MPLSAIYYNYCNTSAYLRNTWIAPMMMIILSAPNVCQSCHGSAKFEPLQSSPFTSTTDWQVAKIQEIQSQVGNLTTVIGFLPG